MLDIHEISKTFNAGTVNEKTALDGLSLHLNEGDFVTVIGGNGAGKSTMLNAVAGVWAVDSGTIKIDSVDVTRFPEYKRADFLGRVFQTKKGQGRVLSPLSSSYLFTLPDATGIPASP